LGLLLHHLGLCLLSGMLGGVLGGRDLA
jgi:hypothetical protein